MGGKGDPKRKKVCLQRERHLKRGKEKMEKKNKKMPFKKRQIATPTNGLHRERLRAEKKRRGSRRAMTNRRCRQSNHRHCGAEVKLGGISQGGKTLKKEKNDRGSPIRQVGGGNWNRGSTMRRREGGGKGGGKQHRKEPAQKKRAPGQVLTSIR